MNRRALTLVAVPFAMMSFAAVLLTPPAAALLPITITTLTGLGFGQVIATSTPGIVTVTPAGTRSVSGGAVLGNGLGVTAGTFLITGDLNNTYSITLPSSATLSSGAGTMTADNFTSSPSDSGNLGLGTQVLAVGADLHVGASQSTASYSGTYAVTVAYN
jgi:Domain of unknown function (DUF4402)